MWIWKMVDWLDTSDEQSMKLDIVQIEKPIHKKDATSEKVNIVLQLTASMQQVYVLKGKRKKRI